MFLVEPILFSYYKRKSKLLRFHKRKFSTALIIDNQLSRKKIRQKFSVIKTNTSDDIKKIVHFGILIHILSWKQKKHKCLLWLLRISDKFFDVIIGDQ